MGWAGAWRPGAWANARLWACSLPEPGEVFDPPARHAHWGCRLSRAHARIFDRRMHEDSGGWRSGLASRGPLASSLGIGCPHELARCFSTPFFLSADAHHLQPARRPSGSAAFRGRSLLRGVKSKRGARLADAAPHRTLQPIAARRSSHPGKGDARVMSAASPSAPATFLLARRCRLSQRTRPRSRCSSPSVVAPQVSIEDRRTTSSSVATVARGAAASSVKLQAGGLCLAKR